MIISIASGKGGTGKTTVAVNMALSIENVQFLDCDVEEPNAHIFLKPRIEERTAASALVPRVDDTKCTYCGRCAQICEYNAIAVLPKTGVKEGKVLLFPELCHSCGACTLLCPEKAISEHGREIGIIETGKSGDIEFAHGRLNIGEAMSPPLIRQVKKLIDSRKTVIIDAPPGTSCPVITSIKGSDFCLLVTEPTPFGLNDLILAVEALRKLGIPFGVIINRSDLGNSKTEEYCASQKIDILMRLPFKKEIAQAYSKGIAIVEILPEYKERFRRVFKEIRDTAGKMDIESRQNKATLLFRGPEKSQRLNCALSVATSFDDTGLLSDTEKAELKGCGFGRAPGGHCGSLYAALMLAEKAGSKDIEKLRSEFADYAGSYICKEIREARKATCLQTVVKAVELAERLLK